MEQTETHAKPATTWALPMGVGALVLLYGLALLLMGDGDAPEVLLLIAVLGAAAIGWGYYVKNRDQR